MKKLFVVVLGMVMVFGLNSLAMANGTHPPPPNPFWVDHIVGEEMTPDRERVFFSNFEVIGDSLSAGCQGLNVQAGLQKFSWPNQLANSMKTVSPDLEFYQPLVNYPGVGIPNPDDWCREDSMNHTSPLTTLLGHSRVGSTLFNPFPNQDKMSNMAITGATLSQVMENDAFSAFNGGTSLVNDLVGANSPFAYSVLGGLPLFTVSAVDQTMAQDPSFLTIWIGNNDVVFATALCDPKFCTKTEFFESKWNELVGRIKSSPTINGVLVINLPDNTKAPLLQDPGNAYHTLAEGFVPSAGSKVPFFSTFTGPNDPYLTPAEMEIIRSKTQAINRIIEATCVAENWAMIDAWSLMNEGMENGWILRHGDGSLSDVVLTADFPAGGMFSYDGMHPSSSAYAYMADLAVDAINDHYGTHLPYVDAYSVWQQDRLCQDPIEPRDEREMCELISDMFNFLGGIL